MQIVIDIPEQMYLNAKADLLCGADILVSAIKNGIPHETVTEFADRCRECGRERVLDKIRAEIEQITDTMGVSYNQYVSKIDVLQIIDKYKAESKNKNETHISLAVIDGCKNLEDSFGDICVRCNECGRFDKAESEDKE